MSVNEMGDISGLLPGHHCGACGFLRCDQFGEALLRETAAVSACPVLTQERYGRNLRLIEEKLGAQAPAVVREKPVGLIDGYEADFVLKPLAGEGSCREILLPIAQIPLEAGQVIRYRPLGCPIVHFARIREKRDGLLVVHIVGPRHRLGDTDFTFTDIGVCMVIGFEGDVEGEPPAVGLTVRFMPHGCMMGKVHSGVVVKCEGRTVLIEGLDLKVWAPAARI